jgi:hypothetical protein
MGAVRLKKKANESNILSSFDFGIGNEMAKSIDIEVGSIGEMVEKI